MPTSTKPTHYWNCFRSRPIRQATQTIVTTAEVTEDKTMYDAREKAIRDYQWAMNSARDEGEIKGKIEGEIKGKIEGEIKISECFRDS